MRRTTSAATVAVGRILSSSSILYALRTIVIKVAWSVSFVVLACVLYGFLRTCSCLKDDSDRMAEMRLVVFQNFVWLNGPRTTKSLMRSCQTLKFLVHDCDFDLVCQSQGKLTTKDRTAAKCSYLMSGNDAFAARVFGTGDDCEMFVRQRKQNKDVKGEEIGSPCLPHN